MLDGGPQGVNNPTVFVINVDPEQRGAVDAEPGRALEPDQGGRSSWFHRAVMCLSNCCCKCRVSRSDTLQLLTSERFLQREFRVSALDTGELANRLNDPEIAGVLSIAEGMDRRERSDFQRDVISGVLTNMRRGIESAETINPPDAGEALAQERLRELRANIVPYESMPEIFLEPLDSPRECCILEDVVEDLVSSNGRCISYKVLEGSYLGSAGLDPYRNAVDWQEVRKVVELTEKGALNLGYEPDDAKISNVSNQQR